MKYIIFGAGGSGEQAFRYFGRNRVLCFADNGKAGMNLFNKDIISFKDMIEICRNDKKIIIVIASENYGDEMEQQVKAENISRYFVYKNAAPYLMNKFLPCYYLYKRQVHESYTQVLANYDLLSYQRIAIYGVNRYLPYLITEVMDRNPNADIRIILQNNHGDIVNTLGLEIVDFVSGVQDIDALIINVKHCEDNVRERLNELADKAFDVLDLFSIDDFKPMFQHEELAVYKNMHKGKRVFIIGTGPSLRIEDLDTLHKNNEICIACNKIYRVYDKTPWRADYYGFLDGRVIEDCIEDIPDIPGTVFFGDSYHYDINNYIEGVKYFHYKEEGWYPNYPRFSDDFTKGFYAGGTTTYSFGIQLAAYMGFAEIYLLGVDHNINGNIANEENHFIKGYYREGEAEKYKNAIFKKDIVTKSYEGAEIYSRKHGFRIYNATRGGKLEAFERVDFDSLFD